jgi:hypothetical protein
VWCHGSGPVLGTFRRADVHEVGVCGVAVGGMTIVVEEDTRRIEIITW